MRRQAAFLVEKRDGRREWLRTAKLARSLQRALAAVGEGDEWLAAELAPLVVASARAGAGPGPVASERLAEAAVSGLVAHGHAAAAARYRAFGCELRRRHDVAAWAGVGPSRWPSPGSAFGRG